MVAENKSSNVTSKGHRKVKNMLPTNVFGRYSETLKNLGLSDYEIRVFLTLLLQGPMNYRNLSRESGVPTGKIYQVLTNLESKSFVESSQDRPKVVRALEPKKAFRNRLRQLEEEFIDLEMKTRDVLQTLQFQYNLKYDKIQGIVSEIFIGGASSASKIRENLLKAEDEVLFSTGEFFASLQIEDLFRILLKQGVEIKAVVAKSSPKSMSAFDQFSDLGVDVRRLDILPSKYFVVDDKYVSLLIEGHESETCIQIQGSALCRVFREKFMDTWDRALPLQRKINSYRLMRNAELEK
jgi:sugar-specific transcriptional regulator TrmB